MIEEEEQLESPIKILEQNVWESSHTTSKSVRWSCACRDALKKRKPARNEKLEEVRKWSEKLGLNLPVGCEGLRFERWRVRAWDRRDGEWGLEIEDEGWGLESDRWMVRAWDWRDGGWGLRSEMEGEGLRDGGWCAMGDRGLKFF